MIAVGSAQRRVWRRFDRLSDQWQKNMATVCRVCF